MGNPFRLLLTPQNLYFRTNLCLTDKVLEIGPGSGDLTVQRLEKAMDYKVVEIAPHVRQTHIMRAEQVQLSA